MRQELSCLRFPNLYAIGLAMRPVKNRVEDDRDAARQGVSGRRYEMSGSGERPTHARSARLFSIVGPIRFCGCDTYGAISDIHGLSHVSVHASFGGVNLNFNRNSSGSPPGGLVPGRVP